VVTTETYQSVLIGGGPSGTGPLVYGAWSGRLKELLDRGVAVVESSDELCVGRLGRYAINSNSTGSTFLECFEHGMQTPYLKRSLASTWRAQVDCHRDDVLPLSLVGELLRELGRDLGDAIDAAPASKLLLNTRAETIRIAAPGRFEITLRDRRSGDTRQLQSQRVLIATGGDAIVSRQAGSRAIAACVAAGAEAMPLMISSDQLLQRDGWRSVQAWLAAYEHPRVLVLGASHSAFSSAWLLLERMAQDTRFDAGSITVLRRSPVKVFYETVAEANADGFTGFCDSDVGKRGQVYPIAGLRGDSKQLYRRIAGLGGQPREDRVRIAVLPDSQAGFDALDFDWANLALVVFANGYSMPEVPVCNANNTPVALHGHYTDRYVDQQSRLLDVTGNPIPGLYAAGLSSGYSPVELLGGEASYSGKENSVWLCQHMLGEALFDALTST
jgi:hypothetical protein